MFWLLFGGIASGQEADTQKTEEKPIGPTGRTADAPRPDAPNVKVQHILTVKTVKEGGVDKGVLTLKVKFRNCDANAKKFLFCEMVGIKTTTDTAKAVCTIKLNTDVNPPRVECEAGGTFMGRIDSWHFGCKLIDLTGNEEETYDFGTTQPAEKFANKKAADFQVTYGDYIELPANAVYDPNGTCPTCFGLDRTTMLGGTNLKALGDWYCPELPFDDPYIQYQPIDPDCPFCPLDPTDPLPFPPEYRPIEDPLAVPSDFPKDVDIPELERNIPQVVPPFYDWPLYLFDIYTMDEGAPPEFVSATVDINPPSLDVTLEVLDQFGQPLASQFTILGGVENFGLLRIHRPLSVLEGQFVDVQVTIHEPDPFPPTILGDALFAESFRLNQDRLPPRFVQHTVSVDPLNRIHATARVRDETTHPLGANLWYSIDGGISWEVQELHSTSDLFQPQVERVFTAMTGSHPPISTVQYFFTAHDGVFNRAFHGVGEVQGSTSVPAIGSVGLLMFGLAITLLAWRRIAGIPNRVRAHCPAAA